ncbi:hypothetical protein ASPWEDRAFT_38968 [Aspergillus wentii DTO 134E9]|uniref:Uncharacterized protein n=1 Tax=Aspergillus wentii DTO 134E9 TaxID=1073089 RepID=A0A1L9RQQ2_ASPWE|nr:uncharacterized protein ASPWEDRAFT_38968 [Aspergillus wentii DTO 134E9]KAI9928231.1 WD repeat-containing protein 44 [Aspergillus wentii]OJJ37286.1 hypothetical protein ASPWEDRAFT_38968 [Aspergillus wentii DTO 134E9]
MAEGSRAPTETEAVPRSSMSPALPAIVTTTSNNSTASKPTPIRTSQSYPIGSAPSDVASGSSGNNTQQQDARRNAQSVHNNTNNALSPTGLDASAESSAIDPLSQHIIKRTNTQKSIPLRLLGKASYEAEAGGPDSHSLSEQSPSRGDAVPHQKPKPPKEKKKAVSFLSRIIGKKKDQLSDSEDDVSEPESNRMDADAAQRIGFTPRIPPPPKYLRVKAQYKKEKTFNRVFVAQELDGADEPSIPLDKGATVPTTGVRSETATGKAVWALVFSNDGKYLAVAGQDRKVRVWAVIDSAEEREAAELRGEGGQNDGPPRLKAPVFKSKPVQVYEGHTGSILDLSWSKNNFLLSSSMDRTVRLWHVSRAECLCCFQHSDFVTSIQFHPRDDRFFLAGSLDTKLRLWSIPDKSVAFVATVPDMITSVAFTPDGRHSIAGCLNGMCNIYETDGLKAIAQIHVRSARGRNAKGSKITGIDTIALPANNDLNAEVKLLITSNDSRIRIYNFRDRTLEAKFRGNENTCSQIRASFSDDGKHVICGSEDRKAYIWPTGPVEKDADKRAVEIFDTQTAMVTAAIMAPTKTKQVLGFSEDPIYDLCNPPPVTLVSQAEPASKDRNRNSGASKLAQESPAYLSRSTHPDGNIIIVADYSGKIKVLRQDCAYQRRRTDSWDTHSTLSRKILRRSNSARLSIASSIGKDSAHKTPSERIISWRNAVIKHDTNRADSRQGTRTRSPSPHKLSRYSSPRRVTDSPALTVSPPHSDNKSSMDSAQSSAETSGGTQAVDSRPLPRSAAAVVKSGKEKDNPLWLQGDQSYAYWNKITHDALASQQRQSKLLSPHRASAHDRHMSVGSALSSDYASSAGEADDGEVLKCENCGGTNFRATKGRNSKQRLVCVRCHRPIS